MTQLRSLEALLKVREGFVDLDEVVPDGFLPPETSARSVLCRVQVLRNGGVFTAYVEVRDALKLKDLCETKGLAFAGVYATKGWS